MKKIIVFSFAAAISFSSFTVYAAQNRALPDPEPYAALGGAVKLEGSLEGGTFPYERNGTTYELGYGAIVFGNKNVAFRRNGQGLDGTEFTLNVNVDGRVKVKMYFAPCWHMKQTDCTVVSDAKTRSVTAVMPYVSKETNKPETFTIRLSPNGPDRVKVSWESTENGAVFYASCTDDRKIGSDPSDPLYRGKKVVYGDHVLVQHTREEVLAQPNGKINFKYPGDFTVDADNPLAAVTIGIGSLPGEHIDHESVDILAGETIERWNVGLMRGIPKTGSFDIDLHDVAVAKNKAIEPVGGVDFWKSDGFHYAKSPTRNLFRNPSFERGLLYWHFTLGGAYFDVNQDQNRYVVEEGGLFGGHCLHLRPVNTSVQGLRTFPMALDAGKRYTLSCYVKVNSDTDVKLAICNAARGGPIKTRGPWGDEAPEAYHHVKASEGWKRISRTFTGDAYGLIVFIGGHDCLFDGFQLEEGEAATEFTAPPMEAYLVTGKDDNYLYRGEAVDFKVAFTGEESACANVAMTISDVYGEIVTRHELKKVKPGEVVLKKNLKWPYTGVFRVRYDITPLGGKTKASSYVQYDRFSVIEPLENRHATKNLFACFSHCDIQARGVDKQRRLMEFGFGSTTWVRPKSYMDERNAMHILFPKFRFNNLVSSELADYTALLFPEEKDRARRFAKFRDMTDFTPEQLKIIEDAAYEALKDVSPEAFPVVAFSNEEESSAAINGANDGGVAYGKVQYAFYKGAKRANPKFAVAPTHGTSGWCKLRGRKAYEQYLNAANLNGYKFDAVAVHPYGNIDGGTLGREDFDLEIRYMQELLGKYGYDPLKTPIYLSEAYNHTVAYIPEWNCGPLSQDGYNWGKTGYDFGNREYQDACQLSRMYLMAMKHWPQVKCLHCWMDPIIDASLRPRTCALAVNTIGRFLSSPVFVGEAHPVGGVRAYVWKQGDEAVAAVWAVDSEAEMGRRKCIKINVAFTQEVRFYDMMGNERSAPDTLEKGLQLTSAPLYLKAKDATSLLADIRNAFSSDAASCVKAVFVPDESGNVYAKLSNLTDREQKGVLEVDGKARRYAIPAKGESTIKVDSIPADFSVQTTKTYSWKLTPDNEGKPATGKWDMSAVFVSKCITAPDWKRIPEIEFKSWNVRKAEKKDCSATYQVCWNDKSFFVKVNVKDSDFVYLADRRESKDFFRNLYNADGALEVYFDCGANGRAASIKGYDDDDYRYDFAPPAENRKGAGYVWRFVEVDHQLADGVNMPTKEECTKKIKCEFTPTGDGYSYEIVFDRRYIEPILLSRGAAFGFALYVHDYDSITDAKNYKGISTCTAEGVEAQYNPSLWPTLILK